MVLLYGGGKIPYSLNCSGNSTILHSPENFSEFCFDHCKDFNFGRRSSPKGEILVFLVDFASRTIEKLAFLFVGFRPCDDSRPETSVWFPRNRGKRGRKMWFLGAIQHPNLYMSSNSVFVLFFNSQILNTKLTLIFFFHCLFDFPGRFVLLSKILMMDLIGGWFLHFFFSFQNFKKIWWSLVR